MKNPEEKIITDKKTLEYHREYFRVNDKKLVVTNGCFDLLHRGHVEYLYKARKQGDGLLVLLNSDSSVRMLKGEFRPVKDEYSRALILAGFYFVDLIYIFSGLRCTGLLETVKPDIYIKGGDYTIDTINTDEKNILLANGAEIRFIKFRNGFSSSDMMKKIRDIKFFNRPMNPV